MTTKKLTSRQLQREVLRIFKRQPKTRFNPKQIGKKLKVENNSDSILYAIEQLVEKNLVTPHENYKFQLKREANPGAKKSIHEGKVDMTKRGSAYIVCEDLNEDVHVAAQHLNTALEGDKVRIKSWLPRGRSRREGEVINVLERANEFFIGTFHPDHRFAIVTPDIAPGTEIIVEFGDEKNAKAGDKVVVKVHDWSSKKYKSLLGKVTSVLGPAGSSDIEMKAILINNGFELEFPEDVIAESEALPTEITEEEAGKRLDLRGIATFTIDPDTAKDFDDAISINFLENGSFEIGVHIADVSHFVKPGSPLDKEGAKRSTSVYLVDRVLPMLPEKLSNELCSLRPDEDKLTFSAIFTFDKNQNINKRWFGKTIIHSDKRFTYEEAQEGIENGTGVFVSELKLINRIAKKLRKKRFKKGAINFDTDEVKFRLDEEGTPLEVYVKERFDAHLLIEEFMLLANREVATFIIQKGKQKEIPFVYRIHDEPDPTKVEDLALFAKEMGFEMNTSSPSEIALSYNRLMAAAKEDPALKLLEPLAIRTMSKAAYSTENIGHYGLAFENYSHFTSPIRRYSDVLAHRILFKNLEQGAFFRTDKEILEETCIHISTKERQAMAAERESVKYKQVEFMEKHLGEVFTGYISGIIDRGIFVELKDNRCEGLMSFDTMDEGFEISNNLKVKGLRSGKLLKMGDEVRARVINTDLARRKIDLAWTEEGV